MCIRDSYNYYCYYCYYCFFFFFFFYYYYYYCYYYYYYCYCYYCYCYCYYICYYYYQPTSETCPNTSSTIASTARWGTGGIAPQGSTRVDGSIRGQHRSYASCLQGNYTAKWTTLLPGRSNPRRHISGISAE